MLYNSQVKMKEKLGFLFFLEHLQSFTVEIRKTNKLCDETRLRY